MLSKEGKNLLCSIVTPVEILTEIANNPDQLETYKFCSKLSTEQVFDIHNGTSNNLYNQRVVGIMRPVSVRYGNEVNSITVCYPDNVITAFGERMETNKFSSFEIDKRVIENPMYQQEIFMANKIVLNKKLLPQVTGVHR